MNYIIKPVDPVTWYEVMEICLQKLRFSMYAPIARNNKMWILFRNINPISNDANLNKLTVPILTLPCHVVGCETYLPMAAFHKSQCSLRYLDPMSKSRTPPANALWSRDWSSRPMSRIMIGQRLSAMWVFSQLSMTQILSGSALVTHSTQATPPMAICHCHA